MNRRARHEAAGGTGMAGRGGESRDGVMVEVWVGYVPAVGCSGYLTGRTERGII